MDHELFTGQTGLIDPVKLTQNICIVGGGSIGGWGALCLGKLGCQKLTVMDFDTIEKHNVGSQIFTTLDLGQRKTDALRQRLDMLLENPIHTIDQQWTPEVSLRDYDIVIAAVDHITPRQQIFEHLQGGTQLYIDARMAGNAIEIYTVRCNVKEDLERYEKTLFAEEDTIPVPCSEKSVVYNVFNVASWIGVLVAKYANGEELPREIVVDLKNLTLFT